MKKWFAFLLCLLVTPTFAQQKSASTDSGPELLYFGGTAIDLLNQCKVLRAIDRDPKVANINANPFHFEKCAAYIVGIIDGLQAARTVHPQNIFFCTPDGAGDEELVRVVLRHSDDHPEDMHLPAATFVVKALARVYPCHAN